MDLRVLLVAAVLAAAPAAAHVNARTDAPSGITDPLTGATATVTLFASCAVVAAEYDGDAAGARTPLTLLLADPPSWINYTGDDVPFTMSSPTACDTTPDPTYFCPCVYTSGDLTFVPGPMAPAFETFTLQPDAVNRHGGDETVQGGAFDITVGYYALVQQLDEGHIDLADGDAYVLVLDVASNGATDLAIQAVAPDGVGLVGLPSSVRVDSPLLDGRPNRTVEIPFQIRMNGTMAMGTTHGDHAQHRAGFMVNFTVTPAFNGTQSATGTPGTASVHVVPAAMEHDHEHEDAPSNDAPVGPLGLLMLALLALARRR